MSFLSTGIILKCNRSSHIMDRQIWGGPSGIGPVVDQKYDQWNYWDPVSPYGLVVPFWYLPPESTPRRKVIHITAVLFLFSFTLAMHAAYFYTTTSFTLEFSTYGKSNWELLAGAITSGTIASSIDLFAVMEFSQNRNRKLLIRIAMLTLLAAIFLIPPLVMDSIMSERRSLIHQAGLEKALFAWENGCQDLKQISMRRADPMNATKNIAYTEGNKDVYEFYYDRLVAKTKDSRVSEVRFSIEEHSIIGICGGEECINATFQYEHQTAFSLPSVRLQNKANFANFLDFQNVSWEEDRYYIEHELVGNWKDQTSDLQHPLINLSVRNPENFNELKLCYHSDVEDEIWAVTAVCMKVLVHDNIDK